MEKYIVMKKIAFAFLLVLLFPFPLHAEKPAEVSLRFGRQENGIRLVLEADEELIGTANIISLSPHAGLRVEFPAPFEIRIPKDCIFEVSTKGRVLFVNLTDKGVLDIKVSKLLAPSRLIFDLKLVSQPKKETNGDERNDRQATQPQKNGAQKPPVPTVPQPSRPQNGQKTQPSAQNGQRTPAAQPQNGAHRIRTVVIDAGHGGYDYGITSNGTREKDMDLALAKDLGAALAKRGMTVYLTRKTDQYTSIGDRINFANSKSPDLFISIHATLSNSFVVYASAVEDMNIDAAIKPYSLVSRQNRHIESSRELSKALAGVFRKEFGTAAIREAPLPLLNALNAPAVLVECPSPSSSGYGQKEREKFVNSVIKGIIVYEQ